MFLLQGWKLTVVLWPEATGFSAGPPDFEKWWSDRPPDFWPLFALFCLTFFFQLLWDRQLYLKLISFFFSFILLGCSYYGWFWSSIRLSEHLKQYPNPSHSKTELREKHLYFLFELISYFVLAYRLICLLNHSWYFLQQFINFQPKVYLLIFLKRVGIYRLLSKRTFFKSYNFHLGDRKIPTALLINLIWKEIQGMYYLSNYWI